MPNDLGCFWPDISPPKIATPVNNGATFIAATGLVITLSPWISSTQLHDKTDYELWTGPGGSGTMAWSALLDTGLITKVVPPMAVSAGTYYIRARMRSVSKVSAWSEDRMVVGT